MIVLSSATTGAPGGQRLGHLVGELRSGRGHGAILVAQVRDDGVRAGHGQRRRPVAVRRGVREGGAREQPWQNAASIASPAPVTSTTSAGGARRARPSPCGALSSDPSAPRRTHTTSTPRSCRSADRAERGELVAVRRDREDRPVPAQQRGDPRAPSPRSPGRGPPGRRARAPRRRSSPGGCRRAPPAPRDRSRSWSSTSGATASVAAMSATPDDQLAVGVEHRDVPAGLPAAPHRRHVDARRGGLGQQPVAVRVGPDRGDQRDPRPEPGQVLGDVAPDPARRADDGARVAGRRRPAAAGCAP